MENQVVGFFYFLNTHESFSQQLGSYNLKCFTKGRIWTQFLNIFCSIFLFFFILPIFLWKRYFIHPATQVNLSIITFEGKALFQPRRKSKWENQRLFCQKEKSENISIQGHSYLNKSQPASHSRLYLYFEPGNICLIVGGHVTISQTTGPSEYSWRSQKGTYPEVSEL